MTYLTQSEEELWVAAIDALEGEGFTFNSSTTSIAQYLETCLGQSNALETKSIAHMLADINASFGGSLSHLTSSVAHLLDDLATNIGAGGGGGGIPAWAQALRDLVSDPDDFLFGYNFASGGTGEGWNNVTEQLRAVGDCWETPFWAPGGQPFNPANIIDGLGLGPATGSNATTLSGLIPDLSGGGTLLIAAKAYAPVTENTSGHPFVHLVDNPGDNFEGGIDFNWGFDVDQSVLRLSNGNGSTSTADTISPQIVELWGACNYLTDGSAIVGSVNGRPNGTRSGSVVSSAPNTLAIHNSGTSDVPVFLTIVAVFALQADVDLPAMSTLP